MRTTDMNTMAKGLGGAVLLLALAACGSGLNSSSGSSGSGSKPTGVSSGSALVELGSGVGTSFKQGTLSLQVASLQAGGSTQITANIVDANNADTLYTQSVTVTFTSNCASAGTANITASVVTTNGTALATYAAAGCTGKDVITATALVGSTSLTATADITVAAPTIGSITFVSAVPPVISLQGVGGPTTSKVTFQVVDADGNPVADTTVDFKLSTIAGGVSLSPSNGVTDSTGSVSTFVEAGSAHTSVNVTATVANDPTITQTTPNAIAISTGIPTQPRFSLSLQTHNLSLSFDHDAQPDTVSVFAVDRYGNPVTPGTNILFTTNSGVIFGTCSGSPTVTTACGSCQTDTTGHCSVTWESEGNRPDPVNNPLEIIGHAHILAYTVGEENFVDNDNDGVFDNGDTFQPNTSDTFYGFNQPIGDDIGDPYMDLNETGAYVVGKPYENIANNHKIPRRAPDGKWYGAGCGGFSGTTTSVSATGGTVTCANTLTMVGRDDCIAMSTDGAVISGITTGETITHGGPAINFTIVDLNGNPIGSGSTVAIVPVNASGVSLTLSPSAGGTTFTQGDQGCTGTATLTFSVTATTSSGTIGGAFYILYTSTSSGGIPATTVQSPQVNIN